MFQGTSHPRHFCHPRRANASRTLLQSQPSSEQETSVKMNSLSALFHISHLRSKAWVIFKWLVYLRQFLIVEGVRWLRKRCICHLECCFGFIVPVFLPLLAAPAALQESSRACLYAGGVSSTRQAPTSSTTVGYLCWLIQEGGHPQRGRRDERLWQRACDYSASYLHYAGELALVYGLRHRCESLG